MKNRLFISIMMLLIFTGCKNHSEKEFNKEKWKSGSQIERGEMVTDLINKKEVYLINKTQFEIIELLGEPKSMDEKHILYLVDYGYLTPFYLDIYFNKKCYNVEITD